MPPLLVIVATIAGGSIAGIVGILIGIPIAGAIKVVFDYVVAERLRGQEAAREQMLHSDTDIVGRVVFGEECSGRAGADRPRRQHPAQLQPVRNDPRATAAAQTQAHAGAAASWACSARAEAR